MRSPFALLLLPAWYLNVGQAWPFEKYNDRHEASSVARNQTLWRRVRTGPGGGGTAAPTISGLFTVGDGSTPGGCSGRETLINSWIEEAILLHDAVETAYEDFKSNRRLMMLWMMFFGIKFDVAAGTVDMDDDLTEVLWPAIGRKCSNCSILGSCPFRIPWLKLCSRTYIFCIPIPRRGWLGRLSDTWKPLDILFPRRWRTCPLRSTYQR